MCQPRSVKFWLIAIAFLATPFVSAQNVGINETGNDPDLSAILDVSSSNKGVLIPRMTKAARLSIPSVANSLLVYQTDDTVGFWYYDQTRWVPIFQHLNAGAGLTGGKIEGYGTIGLQATAVVPGTYGAADSIPQFTVNSYGQLEFAGNIPLIFPEEQDSIIGNEIADTINSYGILNRFGSGTTADPYRIGVNPGLNPNDIMIWDGVKWTTASLTFPLEQDSIIGNEIADTTLARGILLKTGSGTGADPYRVGIEAGTNPGDVWMWNGAKWVSGTITFPDEKDSVIGNEIADTLNSRGMLNRAGSGTSADPYTVGINPGSAAGDIWMWDGAQWNASKFVIPTEQDSVIGNEVADTINSRGILNIYGAGTNADPLKLGVEPGDSVGAVWMWDGTKWTSSMIQFPTVAIPDEKDSVIGNEIADTLNTYGLLNRAGSGTVADPYTIGSNPGTANGQIWQWDGTKWALSTIVIPLEQDSVIGNEVSDTLNSRGILTKQGAGTAADPLTLGIKPGNNSGDVWMWDGTTWVPTQITYPLEQDSVIGNELADTINSRGILTKTGAGTAASPYRISINAGSANGDVWMWNGSDWVPTQISFPAEVDGIVGNEVSDTITNGFIDLTGAGTAADPRKIGLKPGNAVGDVIMWDGSKWVTGYLGRNTLDGAYDEGGSGAGRIITADNGEVEVQGTDGFIVSGTYGSGATIGTPGAGTRMFFNPRTASFRAGRVFGTNWDASNSGAYTFSTGLNTLSSGNYSFTSGYYSEGLGNMAIAMGDSSLARNSHSVAIGDHARVDGSHAMAIGENVWAYGQNSVVVGQNSYSPQAFTGAFGAYNYANATKSYIFGFRDTTTGDSAVAIGSWAYAAGAGSVALGTRVRTDNPHAIAIGYNSQAEADRSVVIGNYVEAPNNGAFVLGDNSTSTRTSSTKKDQMTMRFDGGYRLFSNSGLTAGVYMNTNVSGWTNYSDREMKENFELLDGESILRSIDRLEITKWNYKNTDESIKYIGPMAQDFYREFKLGGTDSLGINSVAIDGVNMAAIQALSKRTASIPEMERELKAYRSKFDKQEAEIAELRKEIEELKKLIKSEH